MQPSEIVEEVVDYIEQHGWCQYAFSRPSGEVCVLGGFLRVSLKNRRLEEETERNERVALHAVRGKTGRSISRWNDITSRTQEEVVGMLTEVAKDLRNEGQ